MAKDPPGGAAQSIGGYFVEFSQKGLEGLQAAFGTIEGKLTGLAHHGLAASAVGQQLNFHMQRLSLTVGGLLGPEIQSFIGTIRNLTNWLQNLNNSQKAAIAQVMLTAGAYRSLTGVLGPTNAGLVALLLSTKEGRQVFQSLVKTLADLTTAFDGNVIKIALLVTTALRAMRTWSAITASIHVATAATVANTVAQTANNAAHAATGGGGVPGTAAVAGRGGWLGGLGRGLGRIAPAVAVSTAGGAMFGGESGATGGLIGSLGGAGLGALIGSIVPIVGTALGATIGGWLGGAAGAAIGSSGQRPAAAANENRNMLPPPMGGFEAVGADWFRAAEQMRNMSAGGGDPQERQVTLLETATQNLANIEQILRRQQPAVV